MNKIPLPPPHKEGIVGAIRRSELLYSRVFTPKDAGVDNKIFHVWKSKGVIDFVEWGAWAKLSFVELIWLRTLECMRRFGCSVNLMKKIYDYYFTRAYEENLAAITLKENIAYYKTEKNRGVISEENNQLLQQLIEIEKDELLLKGIRRDVSYFSQLVMNCFNHRLETLLIIYEDGSFNHEYISIDRPIEKSKKDNRLLPQLSIPISSFIIEIVTDENKAEFLQKASLFSEEEYWVIKELRKNNVTALTIYFSDKDHHIEQIECDRKGYISGEKAKKVMATLGLKNYSSIELKTRSGSSLSFQYKERIHLK